MRDHGTRACFAFWGGHTEAERDAMRTAAA